MKKYVLIFLLSFVVYWMTAVIRGGYITIGGVTGFPLSMLTGSALYFNFYHFSALQIRGQGKTIRHIIVHSPRLLNHGNTHKDYRI